MFVLMRGFFNKSPGDEWDTITNYHKILPKNETISPKNGMIFIYSSSPIFEKPKYLQNMDVLLRVKL
jgi:23S rRNA G2069 N7-methylase RlmK/C1962 C5-methylase RlmI